MTSLAPALTPVPQTAVRMYFNPPGMFGMNGKQDVRVTLIPDGVGGQKIANAFVQTRSPTYFADGIEWSFTNNDAERAKHPAIAQAVDALGPQIADAVRGQSQLTPEDPSKREDRTGSKNNSFVLSIETPKLRYGSWSGSFRLEQGPLRSAVEALRMLSSEIRSNSDSYKVGA